MARIKNQNEIKMPMVTPVTKLVHTSNGRRLHSYSLSLRATLTGLATISPSSPQKTWSFYPFAASQTRRSCICHRCRRRDNLRDSCQHLWERKPAGSHRKHETQEKRRKESNKGRVFRVICSFYELHSTPWAIWMLEANGESGRNSRHSRIYVVQRNDEGGCQRRIFYISDTSLWRFASYCFF